MHRRRRRIESPGSETRESITWVSVLPQNGHFMRRQFEINRRPGTCGVSARTLARTWASAVSSAGASSTSAMRCASSSHSSSVKPRVVIAGLPRRMPEVTNGFSGSLGIAFLLTVMCARRQRRLGVLAGDLLGAQVDQEHVAVGAAGHDAQAAFLQHASTARAHCRAPAAGSAGSRLPSASPNATALAAMTCISGPPCKPGKHRGVDGLLVLGVAEDDAAARPAQRLVRRAGDEVRDADRRRIDAGGDQPGVVRHVHHQLRAHAVGDRAKALPVDHARIRRRAGDDELRLVLVREALRRVVVDELGFRMRVRRRRR